MIFLRSNIFNPIFTASQEEMFDNQAATKCNIKTKNSSENNTALSDGLFSNDLRTKLIL